MTPIEYRAALKALNMSQLAAGRWLGVSPKTAQNYATRGPSGPAAKAIEMLLEREGRSVLTPSLKVSEAELSVRTSVSARRTWGDDMLLSELIAKTDDEIKAAGMTRKSIKEIREIAECMA